MNDMTAFERRLADGFEGLMGPSEPVDDAVIFAAIPATRAPRPRLGFAFSAAKYVMAVGILALFGGFLLSGILTTQQDDEVLPATATDAPSPTTTDGPAFPTGIFEAAEDGLTLVLRADGTCERAGVPCTFGVTGNVYSEMTFEDPSGAQVPATYYWDFDGEYLTFDSWGTDQRPDREEAYAERTYRLVEAAEPLPSTAETGFPTGAFVPAQGNGQPQVFFRDWGTYSGGGVGGKYAINGDLYTEMTHNSSTAAKIPGTYTWDWDGERLSFRLWGEDGNAARRSLLSNSFVRDESVVVDAPRRLMLSHPQLDYWVTVEIVEQDGRHTATADPGDGMKEVGVGDTAQEAVEAALEALGVPYASEMAASIKD